MFWFFKSKDAAKEKANSNVLPETEPKVNIAVSIETRRCEVESFIAKGEVISPVVLDREPSQSGGFVNWAIYEVIGVNQNTNRKNKRQYEAKTETNSIAKAKSEGLIEPFEIRALPHDAPTERQIDYLLSWGAAVPRGATKYDVSAILSRLEDSYDIVFEKQIAKDKEVHYIRPLPGPNAEFAKYADDMGIFFSRYIGGDALFNKVVYSLGERDKIAFFAYCVLCSHRGNTIGDLRNSPHFIQLYEFADKAMQDASLAKSIMGRDSADYKSPHKGSKAYKAVAEFFDIK